MTYEETNNLPRIRTRKTKTHEKLPRDQDINSGMVPGCSQGALGLSKAPRYPDTRLGLYFNGKPPKPQPAGHIYEKFEKLTPEIFKMSFFMKFKTSLALPPYYSTRNQR